jgi:AAA+ superfamily predicted ATPase
MEINTLTKNSKALQHEIRWFISVLDTRMKLYFENDCKYKDIDEVEAHVHKSDSSPYSDYVEQKELNMEDRIALMLALAPHLRPEILDVFFTRNASYDRPFSEFGGVKGKNFNGFLPSGETLLFIIAGKDLKKRMQTKHFFLQSSILFRENVLKLLPADPGEPVLSGFLSISPEYLSLFTSGRVVRPDLNPSFPARPISTKLDWKDLVLEEHVRNEVEEIRTWIEWNSELKKEDPVNNIIKPGYRTLFYGPPGTGKTLTASLLGKATGREVFKIDLSMIVSKYIGETEKNLAGVFDMAESRNCLLFFDEADALFGKRTATTSSNDRYANQEVAYLLQRIEDFPGLIILATNLKINLDDAFARRFQSMIHFPMPGARERLQLWTHAFSGHIKDAKETDLKKIAEKHVLSGGAIINVLLYCLLHKKSTGKPISEHTILEGIRRELRKEGKTI